MEQGMSGFCMKSGSHRNTLSGGGGATKCGRWNPTAEQVKVLTDLFTSGLRTPSTEQIQKISSQLNFYGKIESKNVFYWFQNHKARERHKRRRVSAVDDAKPVPSKPKHFTDEVREPERVIETLELFPLNSCYDEQESAEKIRFEQNDCGEIEYQPPLDLCLSFM